MDKFLLLKILGKKDSVDLGDMIYNLRDICDNIRNLINLNADINNDFISETNMKLNDIYNTIKSIDNNLKSSDNAYGYTNSRKYLSDFTSRLCSNMTEFIHSLEIQNIKNITYYNNLLIDLILKY